MASLSPEDLRPLFEKILEYADAKRAWDAYQEGPPEMYANANAVIGRHQRLVNVETWLKAFADGIRGAKQ